MKTVLEIVMVVVAVLLVLNIAFLCVVANAKRLPFLFERRAWKVWKECRDDEIVSFEDGGAVTMPDGEVWLCHTYRFASGKYYADVFYGGGQTQCAIYEAETNRCVFSDYWEPYAYKLVKRLEDWRDRFERFRNGGII